MELKCPQCGKWMAVSQEELVIHGSQVVCPQCLAVCLYENGALVPRDDSDAPYRHNASVEMSPRESTKFCYSCGKQLPSGISFCPYCGADLRAPFAGGKPHAVNEPQPTSRQPEPVKEKPKPAEKPKPSRQPSSPVSTRREPETDQVEDKLRTMTHRYTNMHPHLHQRGTMPGPVFKIVAYTIIVLLVLLFVYIVIAGASIEMPK